MPVRELLECVDSRELTEWQAYELTVGPLAGNYRDVTLAAIHDELQIIARLVGGQYKKNPAPKPQRYPRPSELGELAKNQQDDAREIVSFGVDAEGE